MIMLHIYTVLINLLLGRLTLSHLRLIRFPFRRLLRLAGITVEVFLPTSTQGNVSNNEWMLNDEVVSYFEVQFN
jgi:hypothetical protein